MLNARRGWRYLLFACVLLGGLAGSAWSQTTLFGVLPAGPYTGGQMIRIHGTDCYDFNTNNCDSLVFKYMPSGPFYKYRSAQPGFNNPLVNYTGFDGAGYDTIHFTIPCSWPNGTYEIHVMDDEDCDNCANVPRTPFFCGWSNAPQIVINNSSLANLAYGDSTFCVGENGVTPTNSMGTGTFVDLNSTGPLGNMIANPATGLLNIHNGVVGSHQIRFTSSGACPSTDVSTVTVKAMQTDSLGYAGSPYCKSTSLIPAPTHAAFGLTGAYTVNPSPLTGFNATNGSVVVTAPTGTGVYSVTFTPDANSCGYVTTEQMEIINLDSAIFQYGPVYCNGDPIGGYPTSVTSLPLGGGYFRDSSLTNSLLVDSMIGMIKLDTTGILGNHTIGFYPNAVGCGVVKYAHILIRNPNPSGFMVLDTTVCANSGLLGLFPTSSGVFFSPTGDIFFQDTLNGVVDTDSSSSGGPFLITHTNNDATCRDTTQGHITLTPRVFPVFGYGALLFCQNDPIDPVPVFTAGATGGTFSAAPVGPDSIIVDPISGEIMLALSDPGTYDIIYTTPTGPGTCPAADTLFAVKIAPAPDASFNFPEDSVCINTGIHTFISPASGGDYDRWRLTYTNGVLISGGMVGDSLNTDILGVGGAFSIIRVSTKGTCIDSFIDFVSVMARENAAFAYVPDTFCGVDQNPIPSIFISGGGTFSNAGTSLLIIDSIVGMVDLLNSAPGDHIIRYTTNGFCPDSDIDSLYIRDELNPTFSYDRYEFCETTTDTLFARYNDTLFPPGSVTFTCMPPNSALDSVHGTFVLDTVSPDSYYVTMTLVNQQAACLVSYDRWVVISAINADPTATLNYIPNSYCITDDSARATLIATVRDGIYYSNPNTLVWQDRPNGVVDIDNSPPGDFIISYIKQNACLDILLDTITIGIPNNPVLTFYYSASDSIPRADFCKSDTIPPFPKLVPPSFGAYTAVNLQDTSMHMIFTSDSLGTIDLAATPAGVYEITFTESNGCVGSGSQRIRINSGPTIDLFLIPADTFCLGDTVTVNVQGGRDYDILVDNVIRESDTTWQTSILTNAQVISTRVRDGLGCIATDSVQITVFPVPDGNVIGAPGTISGSSPIHFAMSSTAPNTYFTWTAVAEGSVKIDIDEGVTNTVNIGQLAPIDINQTLRSDFTPGTVTFYVTPHAEICNGATDKVTVYINPSNTAIFVPEVFTPDDNGANDVWKIQWRQDIIPDDYEIYIFNRSGGQVDHLPKLIDTWTGNDLPDGVYWYKIQSKLGSLVDRGAVTIRRK